MHEDEIKKKKPTTMKFLHLESYFASDKSLHILACATRKKTSSAREKKKKKNNAEKQSRRKKKEKPVADFLMNERIHFWI